MIGEEYVCTSCLERITLDVQHFNGKPDGIFHAECEHDPPGWYSRARSIAGRAAIAGNRCRAEMPQSDILPPLVGQWCPNPATDSGELCEWHEEKTKTPVEEPEQMGLF